MPVPSPVHDRLVALNHAYGWKDWAGVYAPTHFGPSHEPEYYAFREARGLLDVSPLFKYEVTGKDAARVLARMMTRDITKLKLGRVTYGCWCTDDGKVIDDGTVSRLGENRYRLTAAEPTLAWLSRLCRRAEVTLEDTTERTAAFALQGPTSKALLCELCDVDDLKFFGVTSTKIDDVKVEVSRTGYTGDLGYEVWCPRDRALDVWDAINETGKRYGLKPAGLDALDVARIEAGFIMLGVDYKSAPTVTLESEKSTPFELGLGFAVSLDRPSFVGQEALQHDKQMGSSKWSLVGIEASWAELEALYSSYGLPPRLSAAASRSALPLYDGDEQVGQVTSSTWSPILKKWIGLASVEPRFAAPGTALQLEHTPMYERRLVTAWVREPPFFAPKRTRA